MGTLGVRMTCMVAVEGGHIPVTQASTVRAVPDRCCTLYALT